MPFIALLGKIGILRENDMRDSAKNRIRAANGFGNNQQGGCPDREDGLSASFPLSDLSFALATLQTRSNGRPHRLEPCRGESDCGMVLFTLDLDPTVTAYAIQQQLTGWNRKPSGDLPIVEA